MVINILTKNKRIRTNVDFVLIDKVLKIDSNSGDLSELLEDSTIKQSIGVIEVPLDKISRMLIQQNMVSIEYQE